MENPKFFSGPTNNKTSFIRGGGKTASRVQLRDWGPKQKTGKGRRSGAFGVEAFLFPSNIRAKKTKIEFAHVEILFGSLSSGWKKDRGGF